MKYKVISFDLWETLVYSNPEYKKERTEFIKSLRPNLSVEEIESICRCVKRDLNELVEEQGLSFTSDESLGILFKKLGFQDNSDFRYFANRIKDLFLEHLPLLYPDTIETLKYYKEQGYTLCLSSNTLFIDKHTILEALNKIGLHKFMSANYFDAFVFSDEVGYSKPHINFFKQVQIRTGALRYEILHVGDNKKTDVQGALNYGINYFHINRTNETQAELLINNILNA